MTHLEIDDVLAEERQNIFGLGKNDAVICRPNALCLSGGGIRSAAFALGIIQALAEYTRIPRNFDVSEATPSQVSDDKCLLKSFHYLSTVSGGGFKGGWLAAWLKRSTFGEVRSGLTTRQNGFEATPLLWLRSNTNYLTPTLGFFSGDTIAAFALSVRNLILNWLIALPALCTLIIVVKIIGIISNWVVFWGRSDHDTSSWGGLLIFKCGIEYLCFIAYLYFMTKSLSYTFRVRPSRSKEGPTQRDFILKSLIPATIGAFFLAHFLASDAVGTLLLSCAKAKGNIPEFVDPLTFCPDKILRTKDGTRNILRYSASTYVFICALIGGIIYFNAAFSLKRLNRLRLTGLLPWVSAGSCYGIFVSLGFMLYLQMPDEGYRVFGSNESRVPIFYLQIVFGVPWLLLAQAVAEMIFVGLASEVTSDIDREWFGHTSGFCLVVAFFWLVVSSFVFLIILVQIMLGYFSLSAHFSLKDYIPIIAGLRGIVSALLARLEYKKGSNYMRKIIDASFTLSAFIFFLALLSLFSSLIDRVVFGSDLVDFIARPENKGNEIPAVISNTADDLLTLFVSLLLSALISAVASRWVNTNFFSLHAMYRNRLIRAYLGASRKRRSNALVDMDQADNPPISDISYCDVDNFWCPFLVINTSLNLLLASNPAWQERKATSFTITPLHSGSAAVGYRRSSEYTGDSGISLGTAMAISGAAASPNMGSYSSAGKTFFMTLFNMRLGAWLGNTGAAGNRTFREPGPKYSLFPWVQEAFGLTTEDSPYIYLSDGGHFDNIGLYEMIRRRCKVIFVVDASRDENYKFADLGNSVRKSAIDFGVEIRFYGFNEIKARAEEEKSDFDCRQYFMVGQIVYERDGRNDVGLLLYIKPSYHKNEGASIRGYAEVHQDFPHEKTSNQWFNESQFESYRMLGKNIMGSVLEFAKSQLTKDESDDIEGLTRALARSKAMDPI